MLRSLSVAILGLGLLAGPAVAQTTPAKKPARTVNFTIHPANPKPTSSKAATVQRTNKLNDAAESDKGQSGYAAPGEPIIPPGVNGKNTPPYDGPAAPAKKGTTLATPK